MFLLIFQQKWMFPSKGNQSNIVCEYEVNRLTNETVIRGNRNVNANG